MKYLFVNPVSSNINLAPLIGIPELIGILENENIQARFIDLNLKYFNQLMNKTALAHLIKDFDSYFCESNVETIPPKIKDLLIDIKTQYKETRYNLIYIAQRIDFCRYILRDKTLFYNLPLCEYAYNIIENLAGNVFLIFNSILTNLFPDVSTLRSYSDNRSFYFDIEKLISFFKYKDNQLTSIYKTEIENILGENPTCIGISINMESQLIPALYLCYLLKQKTKIHINIGGSFLREFYKLINNFEQFFGLFFDSVSINENYSTVTELLKYINNKIEINNVTNLIYLENGIIKLTEKKSTYNINNIPIQSFTGYEDNEYLSPDLVIPVLASRSCYYRKCIFCCCCEDDGYKVKSVQKFADEIEYLSKKYNSKIFYFWDNSLHPLYLEKLSEILRKKNLNISYSVYARFEKEFTLKLLRKLKKSGCVKILWGLDTASEKILDYINKGVNLKIAERILKDTYKANISSTLHLILGHPTEKTEDMEKDIEFVEKNKRYIDLVNVAESILFYENSIIANNADEYKSLIHTTKTQRKAYKEFIENISRKNRVPFCICDVGIYNVLYLRKYGRRILFLTEVLYSFLVNNKKLFNIYIKFYIFLYKIKKNSVKPTYKGH